MKVLVTFLLLAAIYTVLAVEDEGQSDGNLCSKKCPQDCGCTVKDAEATCHCTSENHPLIRPPPPPRPPRSFRFRREEKTTLSDDDKTNLCRLKCPQDCTCSVDDGEATCHCTIENHPLIRKIPPPPPTPPSKPRDKREEEEETSTMAPDDQAKLCRQKCQPDCGCLVENGEAKCICTAENNPLIKKTVPPPPELLHTTP